MAIGVYTPEEKGRSHWKIIEMQIDENVQEGRGKPIASCCDAKGGSCKGYDTQAEAEKAGWAYAKAKGIK